MNDMTTRWLVEGRFAVLILAGLALVNGGHPRPVRAGDQKVSAAAGAFQASKEVLIVYKPGKANEAKAIAQENGLEVLEDYEPGRFLRCAPGPGVADISGSANRVAAADVNDTVVAKVEPNYILSIPKQPGPAPLAKVAAGQPSAALAKPNDTDYNKLWGMVNIDAPDAWGRDPNTEIIVGVIDSGVDYNHPDLRDNMWRNPGEVPGNMKDDDGNGIEDDVFGVRFQNGVGSGDPMDDNKHGTHCAGTIGAVGNNHIGVVGVCWKVRIMALKFLRANGTGMTNDVVRCIDYAIAKKANILSNSWGGGAFSQALQDAIDRAETAGILFVVAAGNDGADIDATPSYPASYPNKNILVVASINPADQLSSFSNFGLKTVDLAAPGGTGLPFDTDDIFSTFPQNQYGYLAGTSMATPHVSGAAALTLSRQAYRGLVDKPSQLKDLLMDRKNVRALPSLAGKCVTGGTLDIGFLK